MKEIIGIESVSYTNKNGKLINGVRIYIAEPMSPPHVGMKVKEEFISGQSLSDHHLGEVVAVLYEPTFVNGQYRCSGVLYKDQAK